MNLDEKNIKKCILMSQKSLFVNKNLDIPSLHWQFHYPPPFLLHALIIFYFPQFLFIHVAPISYVLLLHVFPTFGISCAYHVLFINKSFLPKIRIWTIFCWEWMNLIYPNVLEKIGTGQTLVAYSSGDKCQQVCFNGLICVAMKSFISLVDVIKKRKNK